MDLYVVNLESIPTPHVSTDVDPPWPKPTRRPTPLSLMFTLSSLSLSCSYVLDHQDLPNQGGWESQRGMGRWLRRSPPTWPRRSKEDRHPLLLGIELGGAHSPLQEGFQGEPKEETKDEFGGANPTLKGWHYFFSIFWWVKSQAPLSWIIETKIS
jgi:hypothetical protein